jgi:NDP-sugar pyrophosphorylase family protein
MKNQHITCAIFLVAGKGVRMLPLTLDTPKPLLKVAGTTLIEHNLAALPDTVTDIVFVIGYLAEQICTHFGETFVVHGVPRHIHYVEQGEPRGTAHALFMCEPLLATLLPRSSDRYFVLMGDDIYCKADITALEATGTSALLAQEVSGTPEHPAAGGALATNERGELMRIDEGRHPHPILLNAALYTLSREIFTYTPVPIRPSDPTSDIIPELGLPQTLVAYSHDRPVAIVRATRWIHITYKGDLEKAEEILSTLPLHLKTLS